MTATCERCGATAPLAEGASRIFCADCESIAKTGERPSHELLFVLSPPDASSPRTVEESAPRLDALAEASARMADPADVPELRPGLATPFSPPQIPPPRTSFAPLVMLCVSVALFAASIFLVLVGTLAQAEMDIWQVMAEYFRSSWAWIEFRVFFPPSFFPGLVVPSHLTLPGGFIVPLGIYFPGGWLIGGLLLINLAAAFTVRFPIQARGLRLKAGWAVTALGLALTLLVIVRGTPGPG